MKTLSEHLYKSLKQLAVLYVIFAASLIFSNKSIAQVTCPAGGTTFGSAITITPAETAPAYGTVNYTVPAGGARFIRPDPPRR